MGTTENIQAWSTTAATNASADTAINWAEGQDAASVNNSARSMMAAMAKHVDDIGGALVAAGSNALSVTTNQVLSAAQLAAGLRLLVKAAAPNTSGAVTFAPDGLTPATVKRADGTPLQVGDITAGMFLDLVYNPGTSEWWAANKAGGGGDFLSSTQVSAPLSNGVPTSFTNVALTPGDWDVWGLGAILGGSTLCSAFIVGISTVVNNLGSQAGIALGSALLGASTAIPTPLTRATVSVNTNVYVSLLANFTPGTVNCAASIWAQRR